jgi:hypothetical protein
MKRFCVVSGSRTGSSLMQFILWRYVSRKLNYKRALGDLMLRNWLYDTGSGVSNIRLSHMTPYQEWDMDINRTFEFHRRIDLLKKYHTTKYLVKFPADFWLHCDKEHLEYLYENYHFIITDRRDDVERALSYAIAINSNWFTMRKDSDRNKFVKGEFTDKMAELIKHDFLSLASAKHQIISAPNTEYTLLEYEDFTVSHNPFAILGEWFDDWQDYVTEEDQKKLPTRIGGVINKQDYITNWDIFNDWINCNFS